MLADTKIVYLDKTWPIVTGCSYGCPECFARRIATRFNKSFAPTFHPEKLGDPARRKKPTTIGVAFHGDLFDPCFEDFEIQDVFTHASCAKRHQYVFLTKRADEFARFLCDGWRVERPPNWFLGVTVRNESEMDAAAPHIIALAEAGWKVWLSIEPMQGPTSPASVLEVATETETGRLVVSGWKPYLSGVILGGQSGPNAPRLDPGWVRLVRDQCAAVGVPFFFKQASDAKPWAEGYLNGLPLLDGRIHDALAWKLHGKKVR